MTLALRYAVRSDVGLLREGNEDSAYAGPSVLAVADGMGGHAAGEVASAVTIGAMAELDASQTGHPGRDMLADLSHAVASANMRLQQMVRANPAIEGMGTTLTVVLWNDGHAAVCHIGDSRGYLLRDGELYQITHDHTLVQSLVDEGRITEDDVPTHPQRSLLLRALDGRTVAEPDLSVHEAQVGDRYLLCSDGLSGVVSDETLREMLATIADPDEVTRRLIDLAIRGGGPDNITCIVADVVDISAQPSRTPVMAGAAVNGTDPRASVPSTGPFAAASGGRRPAAHTAPQPRVTDDDDDVPEPSVNGTDLRAMATATGRRGHRGSRGRSSAGRRRWPIVTTSLVVLLVVIVAGAYFAWRYTQTQYYVAVTDGEVVVYQGVNQNVVGISLSHPVQHTGIKLSQVPGQEQQALTNTISATSLKQAQVTVSSVQSQVTECMKWYQGLQKWQSEETIYLNEEKAPHKGKKTAPKPTPPGDRPTAPQGFVCQPPANFGISQNSLPANV
jgi:PPM family protein phosphatase